MELPFILSNQPAWRAGRHGVFLAAVWSYYFITMLTYRSSVSARISDYNYLRLSLLDATMHTLLAALLIYPLLYYYLPRLFQTGPTLLLLAMVAATGLVGYSLNHYGLYPWRETIGYESLPGLTVNGGTHALSRISLAVVLALVAKLSKSWYQTQAARQQAEQARIAAQLQVLKAQLQPHFLFNTLNNLYAETLGKADTAAQMILQLSEVLSYVLHESQRPRVPLAAEIQLLENYLALERMRYGSQLALTFDVRGTVAEQQMAPLLFLPLVENAFKHGISESLEEHIWLRITLNVEPGCLRLLVENPCPPPDVPTRRAASSGLGLPNLTQQLHLLYGAAAQLTAQRRPDNIFTASLQIPL